MAKKTFIGKGKVYIGPYDDSSKRYQVGNVSALTLNIEEEEKELIDFTSGGGGQYDALRRVTGVTAEMTLHDILPDNLAALLRGTASAVTAGTVSAEAHANAYVGGLIRTAKNIDTTQTVTVTGDGGTPSWTVDTHFTVTAAGIVVVALPATVVEGDPVEISYTSLAGNAVEALINSGKEYKVTFDGLNEAGSDAPVVVDLHRYRMGVAQNLAFIGDEFAELPVTGDVLKDTAITGAGLSQFFRVEMA